MEYLRALWRHWLATVSGGASVAVYLAQAAYHLRNHQEAAGSWAWLLVLSIGCLLIASYRAWRDVNVEAVAQRILSSQPATGPFPPFPLGGSLDDGDFFDFVGTPAGPPSSIRDHWYPVKKAIEVPVDWQQFKDVELIADISVRGGSCRVGVIDVENDIPVATSDWLHAPRPVTLDMRSQSPNAGLVRVRLSIPRSVGRRIYRLAAFPTPGPSADTFAVIGSITFPSLSLGNTENEPFSPTDKNSLSGPIPYAVEVPIDWSQVHDPLNTVVAEITLTVTPKPNGHGKGRAILRDLSDGNVVVAIDWVQAETRSSMHHRDFSERRQTRFALQRKSGVHRYVLGVEVSDTDTKVAATGTLSMGH